MTVGDRIRETRIRLQLSQTDLAVRANYCDKTRISKIEHSGNDISMKQVRRIADALGVTSAYLMGWEDINGERTATGLLIDAYIKREEAQEVINLYQNASPEIRDAVLTLLKSAQRPS